MNNRIREARKAKNFTQDGLAEEVGVTRTYINLIETGKKEPSDRTIKDICRILNINETWLRTGEGNMEAPEMDEETIYIYELLEDTENPFAEYILSIMKTYKESSPSEKEAMKNFFKNLNKNIKKKSQD